MLKSYFLSSMRNLVRNRIFSGINIVGLAISFSFSLLGALFVYDEYSYDTSIPDHQRVGVVEVTIGMQGQSPFNQIFGGWEIGEWLKSAPEVEQVARISHENLKIRHRNSSNIDRVAWVDENIFSVIRRQCVHGNLQNSLERPDLVVLTQSKAIKYFGRDDVVGEYLEIGDGNRMQISAVLADMPSNVSFRDDIFISSRALFSPLSKYINGIRPSSSDLPSGNVVTVVKVRGEKGFDSLNRIMPELIAANRSVPKEFIFQLHALPITDLHFRNLLDTGGDLSVVYGVMILCVLIVLVASANFINMMTSRAAVRGKEVGIRKVYGADRIDISVQFIGESILCIFIATALSLIIAGISLPYYNNFLQRDIHLWEKFYFLAGLVVVALLVGLLSGVYPALVLSAFRPSDVLKIRSGGGAGSLKVRQILVILQFSVLIGVISGTYVIHEQIDFAMNDALRVPSDQIVVLHDGCSEALRNELQRFPEVLNVSCSGSAPIQPFSIEGVGSAENGTKGTIGMAFVDYEFFDFYGLRPLAGRFFSPEHGSDAIDSAATGNAPISIVINETAARHLGFLSPDAALGHLVAGLPIPRPQMGQEVNEAVTGEIVGVAPDFVIGSVNDQIPALAFCVDPSMFEYLSIKVSQRNKKNTLEKIDESLEKLDLGRKENRFILGDHLKSLYSDLGREGKVFLLFSVISALATCFGMFGLALFIAQRRIREIGIRKALGAGRLQIAGLLTSQFIRLIIIANLFAWPATYLIMDYWLGGVPNHLELNPWIFVLSGLAVMIIAGGALFLHAFSVAGANPATILHDE